LEPDAGHRRVVKKKEKAPDPPCLVVRVTSIRKRLLDWDNLCVKPLVDGLRYAGLIPDDRPEICKIEVRQRKTEAGEEEATEVEIITED